jgi:hypothetical protein
MAAKNMVLTQLMIFMPVPIIGFEKGHFCRVMRHLTETKLAIETLFTVASAELLLADVQLGSEARY